MSLEILVFAVGELKNAKRETVNTPDIHKVRLDFKNAEISAGGCFKDKFYDFAYLQLVTVMKSFAVDDTIKFVASLGWVKFPAKTLRSDSF